MGGDIQGGQSIPVTVERGNVYWINLGDPDDEENDSVEGSEQGLRRPGIVLQNDNDNSTSPTTVIVPTTTGSASEADFLTNVFISSSEECLPDDSLALCSQIRVVDIDERVDEHIGELSTKKLREIEKAVQVVLDFI